MQPDIIAEIQLYKTEDGGREGNTPTDRYSCIINIAGRQHDCRFLLKDIGSLGPGTFKEEVPVKFLSAEAALKDVAEGDEFVIMERGAIGNGKIISIL